MKEEQESNYVKFIKFQKRCTERLRETSLTPDINFFTNYIGSKNKAIIILWGDITDDGFQFLDIGESSITVEMILNYLMQHPELDAIMKELENNLMPEN